MVDNKKKHYDNARRGRGGGNRRRRGRVPVAAQVSIRPLDINEETRWKPRHSLTTREDESDKARDARLVLLLLNKLTPHSFDKVVTAFLSQTTIHLSDVRMRDAIHAIVERAALDVRYAQVHARLCARLATDLENSSFREALVKYCCQENLMDRSTTVDPLFEHPEERHSRLTLERCLYVGTKRFIGELYNNGVFELTELLPFVARLLTRPTGPDREEMKALAFEGLCALLDACGTILDETAVESLEMQRCWRVLGDIASGKESDGHCKLSFRLKCIILDLLELRESGWCPMRFCSRQRKELVAGPLEWNRQGISEAGDGVRKFKRRGGRKGRTVHFE